MLAVFAAVHHAEVIAHRIGEPFGTLVLAVAVTVIEVALIVSLMLAAGAEKPELARDTVFAAVMIAANGIVGLCLLAGGVRHHEQGFQVRGASAALAVLCALSVMTLVLPNHLVATPGADPGPVAARLRGRRLAGALPDLRLRADRPPPRLLPRRGRRGRGRARAAALDRRVAGQPGAPARGAGLGGRARQGALAGHRAGGGRGRRAGGGGGHRHLDGGAAPRVGGGAPGGAEEPAAEQPQPGAGIRRWPRSGSPSRPSPPSRSAPGSPSSWASRPRTRSCSRSRCW